MIPETHIREGQRTKTGMKLLPFEMYKIEDLLHGAMGLSTEAGEVMDALKRYMFYGAPLDKLNIKEELGDILWYVSLLCNHLNVSYEELMQMNIDKLRSRYPEKFSTELAINRDINKERIVLQGLSTHQACDIDNSD